MLESFAILLVGLLSLGIVYFIIQYNMIDDQNFIEKLDKSAYEMSDQSALDNDDLDNDLDDDADLD